MCQRPCRWRPGGSGGGVVAVPGSRPIPAPAAPAPFRAPSPAPAGRRHRHHPGAAVAVLVVASAVGGRRSPAVRRLGGGSGWRRRLGPRLCSSFYEGPVVADDPVARRRPVGAPGPTNTPNAGEKGLLCQRLVDGALGARAARNRAAAWSRSPAHGTIPGTRRPGLAAAPSPAPRSRSWSWWRLRSWWRPAAGLRARLAGWRVGSGSAGAGGGSGRCGRCGRRGDLGPRGSRRRAGRAAALRGSVGGGSVGGGSVGGGSVRAPGFGAQSRRAARSRSWSRLRRSSGRRRRRARFLGGICGERGRRGYAALFTKARWLRTTR